MKNRMIIIGILACLGWNGCTVPKYLPSSGEIGINPFGSYIKVDRGDKPKIKGELFAIVETGFVVMEEENAMKRLVLVPMGMISGYSLRYAKSVDYWWTIPVFTLSTLAHGGYLIFTAPLNLIVTSLVCLDSEEAFVYREDNLTLDELRMFARYPQGLPNHLRPELAK